MKCPICSESSTKTWATSRDVEYFTSTDSYEYLLCDCGVVFLLNPPIENLNGIYPDNYYSTSQDDKGLARWVKEKLDVRFLRSVLRELSADSISVLDIGGGNGRSLVNCQEADPRVTRGVVVDLGTPINAESIPRWIEHNQLQIEEFTTDEKFDLVLLMNLIEHVADPDRVVSRIRELMAPDAVLVIQTPNFESVDARIFRHHNWGGFHTPRHWVIFRESSIHSLLVRHGFEVLDLQYVQGAAFWSVGLFSAVERFLHCTSRRQPMYLNPLFRAMLLFFAAVDMFRLRIGFKTSQMTIRARARRPTDHN